MLQKDPALIKEFRVESFFLHILLVAAMSWLLLGLPFARQVSATLFFEERVGQVVSAGIIAYKNDHGEPMFSPAITYTYPSHGSRITQEGWSLKPQAWNEADASGVSSEYEQGQYVRVFVSPDNEKVSVLYRGWTPLDRAAFYGVWALLNVGLLNLWMLKGSRFRKVGLFFLPCPWRLKHIPKILVGNILFGAVVMLFLESHGRVIHARQIHEFELHLMHTFSVVVSLLIWASLRARRHHELLLDVKIDHATSHTERIHAKLQDALSKELESRVKSAAPQPTTTTPVHGGDAKNPWD